MTDTEELGYLLDRRAAMYDSLLNILYAPRGNHYDVSDVSTLRENILDLDRQILTIRERMNENHG